MLEHVAHRRGSETFLPPFLSETLKPNTPPKPAERQIPKTRKAVKDL